MTVPDRNLARRVTELERRFAAEIRQLRMSQSLANVGHSRHIRLARTAIDPSVGSYPTSGNTFWLEFLDSGFTAAGGTQTPTHATRGISDGAYGHNLPGDYLDEGTVVRAMWQRGLASESDGEWWVERVVASGQTLVSASGTWAVGTNGTSFSDPAGTVFTGWTSTGMSQAASGQFTKTTASDYKLTHKVAGCYLFCATGYAVPSYNASLNEGDAIEYRWYKNGTQMPQSAFTIAYHLASDLITVLRWPFSAVFPYVVAADDYLQLKIYNIGASGQAHSLVGNWVTFKVADGDWFATSI